MKVYTTDEKEATKHGLAWKMETDSILNKEKCKHLSKMSDRVSKMLKRKRLNFEIQRKYSQKYISIIEAYSLSYIKKFGEYQNG